MRATQLPAGPAVRLGELGCQVIGRLVGPIGRFVLGTAVRLAVARRRGMVRP